MIYKNVLSTHYYPILFSVIYDLARLKNYWGIHAAAVQKNDVVLVICGDFGTGKSSLALAFQDLGWRIISTDQTILSCNHDLCQFMMGTYFMKHKGKEYYLNSSFQLEPLVVTKLLCSMGMVDNGDVVIHNSVSNYKRILWNHFSWPWNTLINDYSSINAYKYKENIEHIIGFLNAIEIDVDVIRGDSRKIAEYYDEKFKLFFSL